MCMILSTLGPYIIVLMMYSPENQIIFTSSPRQPQQIVPTRHGHVANSYKYEAYPASSVLMAMVHTLKCPDYLKGMSSTQVWPQNNCISGARVAWCHTAEQCHITIIIHYITSNSALVIIDHWLADIRDDIAMTVTLVITGTLHNYCIIAK